MKAKTAKAGREQSLQRGNRNGLSHGVGLIAALVATPILIMTTVRRGSAWATVGAGVFAFAVVLMYLASTLYHSFSSGKIKSI